MRFFSRATRAEPNERATSESSAPQSRFSLDERTSIGRLEPSDRTAQLIAQWDALCHSARKIMRDPADAEDLAHDTFERALRALDRFAPGTNMRAWLYTIMVRLARDRFRRKHARRSGDVDLEQLPAPAEDAPPDWCRVTADEVRAALDQLSPVLRQVFELHEFDHLQYAEIATRLEIPVNTVASRLRRARERLRELLLAARQG